MKPKTFTQNIEIDCGDDNDFLAQISSQIETSNIPEGKYSHIKKFNFSDRKLAPTEITVLLSGLKFTPTPEK